MIEREVKVVNRAGVHTRPASAIVKLTAKFKSEVQIVRDGFGINGKSIIGVMTLAAAQGSVLQLKIDGEDENECFVAIEELFNSGFGEPI